MTRPTQANDTAAPRSSTFKAAILAGRRPAVRPYGFVVKDKSLPGTWFRTCSWFDAGSISSAGAIVRHAGAEQREVQKDRYVVLHGNVRRAITSGLHDRGWSLYPTVTMSVTESTFESKAVPASLRKHIRRRTGGDPLAARAAWEIPPAVSDKRLTRLTRDDVWFTYGPGVGTARLRVKIHKQVAWIDEFVVDTAEQGSGVGSALFDTAVSWGFAQGVESVELAADTFRWPRRWYASRGFRTTGRFTLAVRWS